MCVSNSVLINSNKLLNSSWHISARNSHTFQGVTDRYKGFWVDFETTKIDDFTDTELNELLTGL